MIIPLERGAIPYKELARILQAPFPHALCGTVPTRLVTHASEVQSGDLFCALVGKRDGHDYIHEACERGASAVISARKTEADIPHLIVPSVSEALGVWARAVTAGASPIRIGVTGSVGKTTVKDALRAALSVRYRVHATHGNQNNELGLPFTLLSAPRTSEVLVCEVGVSHPDEMEPLSNILRPHLSVITCIGHAHIGAFGSRERIAEEKRALLSHAEEGGGVFVPMGEPLLSFLPPRGIRRTAVLPFSQREAERFSLPYVEEDAPRRFALAYALALSEALGLTEAECKEGLSRAFSLQTRRKEEVCKDVTLIDDGYNASPESVMSALDYLRTKGEGGRIAVLGDMLELGEESAAFHRAVGRYAALSADLLVFFGAYASEYERGARAAGAKELTVGEGGRPRYLHFTGTREELAHAIATLLRGKEFVLFKASRAHAVEKTVALLKEELK